MFESKIPTISIMRFQSYDRIFHIYVYTYIWYFYIKNRKGVNSSLTPGLLLGLTLRLGLCLKEYWQSISTDRYNPMRRGLLLFDYEPVVLFLSHKEINSRQLKPKWN